MSQVKHYSILCWCLMLMACGQNSPDVNQHLGIVSLDYCADQYALKLLPKARILALSPDATKYFSYMRKEAKAIRQVDAKTENVMALGPGGVIRSFGGGPFAAGFYQQAGIDVIQLGYPTTIDAIKQNILDVAEQLKEPKKGREVVAQFEADLSALRKNLNTTHREALYLTPGGVTSGPGSLVAAAMAAANMSNYIEQPGWHDLPLERLVYQHPEIVIKASFGDPTTHVDPWTLARHPLIKQMVSSSSQVELEGALTACGAWFLVDAVTQLASGSAGSTQ